VEAEPVAQSVDEEKPLLALSTITVPVEPNEVEV